MLVPVAVWWIVSLRRMKTGRTGQVVVRQLVLATKSGSHGIRVIKIACDARRVVNSDGQFVLREGRPLWLMKWLSRPPLNSCTASCNCRWNNSSMLRHTGVFVDCVFWDLCRFCADDVLLLAIQVWFRYLSNKVWRNAAAKVDQALQATEYSMSEQKCNTLPA